MASLRKKYEGLVVDRSQEPVTTAPTTELAKPPEPIADTPQVPEPVKTESPVDTAAADALKARLAEAERAAEFAQQRAQQQTPQQQPEPETPRMDDPREQFEALIQHLPNRAKAWYRADPSWLTDPERAAHINYAHHVAVRETGTEGSDEYFDRMEHMLGLRNVSVAPPPAPERPRPEPVRPRYAGAPVSAPPTREVPSLSSGRTVNDRTPLTRDEREIARASRMTDQEYQQQKAKIQRMKVAGEMDA